MRLERLCVPTKGRVASKDPHGPVKRAVDEPGARWRGRAVAVGLGWGWWSGFDPTALAAPKPWAWGVRD